MQNLSPPQYGVWDTMRSYSQIIILPRNLLAEVPFKALRLYHHADVFVSFRKFLLIYILFVLI